MMIDEIKFKLAYKD